MVTILFLGCILTNEGFPKQKSSFTLEFGGRKRLIGGLQNTCGSQSFENMDLGSVFSDMRIH